MDHSAIERIQQGDATDKVAAVIDNALERSGVAAIPENFEIADFERFLKTRRRFRGIYKTKSIKDFAKYHRKFGTCFIDDETMTARTIFDFGTEDKPGHQQHCAELSLSKTPEFAALERVEEKQLDQRAMVEWFEDWIDQIVGVNDDGKDVPSKDLLRALRVMDFKARAEHGTDIKPYGEKRSSLESVEMASKVSLPSMFIFRCATHDGLPVSYIHFRLSVNIPAVGDSVKLTIRMRNKSLVLEESAKRFAVMVMEELEESEADVFLGTFK